ncbi:MAG TPA: tetratricopeptide repeat protein [Nitrososphaeraceae archaeon]
MLYDKTKLLLILSVILVSLLSNKSFTPFFEFEGKGIINQYVTLALGSTLREPPQNNTDIRSITSPINRRNSSSSAEVSSLVNQGDALFNQGNYTQAIQYYNKVLDIDPNDINLLNGKGDALNGKGNYTQAIQSFDKVLAVNPEDSSALNGKGNALSGQGNYTQAIPYYDKALAIDPNDKVILTNKADALFHQVTLYDPGNYTQAIQYYDKATQAVQYYDKALAIDPNYKNALNGKGSTLDGIGNAFYNQGNYTKAIQYYNKALSINSTNTGTLFDKQNAITKIVESGNTSGYDRGCIDAQIPNPSERYISQSINGSSFHNKAFMQVYNEGFDACSGNLPKRVEALKMFNIIILKGNITDETANSRICTTVSGGYPQSICQNLDNLKPENNSNSIESHIFTFENVPVNASFHSCIQRLIYPNVTLCDNYASKNYQRPTVEQKILPFFGLDPAAAEDDEGYTSCPTYLTEAQCYGKIVKTPDDGYDINDTSIDQALKQIALTEQQSPVDSLTANQIQVSDKPIVTNQTVILKQGLNATLRGIDPNNKSLNFLIYTEPAEGTITFTKINSTSVNATYFPLEDGVLTDSFSYKASNGVLDSNIGKVILTYYPPQTSDKGNTSSDIQSQPPANQSSPKKQPPGNTEPNQTEPSVEYYKGLDWWGICNNSLVRSYISQPCETLVTPDHRALTSQGKTVLEGVLCSKGPSILSPIELFYGAIPDKTKNELGIACGWQIAR